MFQMHMENSENISTSDGLKCPYTPKFLTDHYIAYSQKINLVGVSLVL